MSEWWAYRLSDFLMFAPDTYRRLFELAHAQVWPWGQVGALVLGWSVWRCAARASLQPRTAAWASLVTGCAWAGAATFVWQHVTTITWAAPALAAAFGVQAALLLALGAWGLLLARAHDVPTATLTGRARAMCLGLLAVGTLAYPLLAPVQGHPWTQSEIFALMPDPTVLATLGLWPLLRPLARRQGPGTRETRGAVVLWWLAWPIPVTAAVLAGATQWAMQAPTAPLLPAAALLATWAACQGPRTSPATPPGAR
jgi:hypothetical protein